MAKRKYTKKNREYWSNLSNKLSKGAEESPQKLTNLNRDPESYGFEPSFDGEPYYAQASYSRNGVTVSNRSVSRTTQNARAQKIDPYSNINSFSLPYSYSSGGVSARDAIILCQKAYANVSIFRNTIDLMSELANSPTFLDGGDKKSQDFLRKWLKRVNIWKLKDQFFREYYRSGNVFLYKIEAQFDKSEMNKIKSVYSEASSNKIVSRYIILNPIDISHSNGLSHDSKNYRKVFSEFE